METVFLLSSFVVLPFWLLMIFAPAWTWTRRVVGSLWSVAPMPVLYAVLAVVFWEKVGAAFPALLQPTLPGIAAVFGQQEIAFIAWVHFLAFDYFVGRWIYLDGREKGRSVWLVGPILVLTLLLGPLGLLSYLLLNSLSRPRSATSNPA
jgi:hypothetical protein